MSEKVDHPAHYGGDGNIYECIKVLESWLTPQELIGFCRGNAIKYLSRADKKDNCEEDLRKAVWYATYEIAFRKRMIRGEIGEGRYRVVGKVGPEGVVPVND